MGRYSYVLIGTPQGSAETFASSCHGAGRMLSRTQAKKVARGRAIAREIGGSGHLCALRRPRHSHGGNP